ncbi:MAG: class I SAM-dependent methyltransferase [Gammaproteobacteria bacterium]|nr:class I SAM-dependent methyltransferase [Gammaproteobacteria bacterium]
MDPILPAAIADYCATHSSPAPELCQELEAYTRQHRGADANMLTGAHEAALLQMLVRLTGARRVLEIGTFSGYSALALAEALPADGVLVTCDNDPEHARIAQSYFDRSPHGRKISLKLGPALETIASLPARAMFDFIFLDADKENYLNYYEAILPRLKTGGLLVADNVLWSGKVLAPRKKTDKAIAALNDRVRNDSRVECLMLPVRDGVSLIRKR